jgi:hypothetical protein
MLRTSSWVTGVLLVLGLGACGSLDNAPFRSGTVHGRLTEFDPAVALISLVGEPSVRATPEASGHFMLEGVPAGPAELFIVASEQKAARVALTVQGGQSVEVEDVAPQPAGTFFLKVHARGALRVTQASATVEGTPFGPLRFDGEGMQRVGPLPDGCYQVSLSAPGFVDAAGQGCVGRGERKVLKIELRPEEDYLNQGCARTGCEGGSHCASDGRCVDCLDNTQCSAPLVCQNFRCEGPGLPCAPCEGNWQCEPSTHCEEIPGGLTACVAKCGGGRACGAGFTCQGGQCLPDATGTCPVP